MKAILFYAAAVILFSTTTAFAKNINLYSQPKTDSTVSGTVSTEEGITIVYTPKNSEWMKVANPKNGDVGWVKSSDLGGNGYTMRMISSGDGAHHYSVYQFGTGNNQLNQQQLEKEMQQLEQQQHILQTHMAHMFNDTFYFPQPIFVPVVMVPEQPKAKISQPAKSPQRAAPM